MRIKDGFIVRKVVNQYLAVPVGSRTKELHGMICLNETGAFLWEVLVKEDLTADELAERLRAEYEVEQEAALGDTMEFVEMLRKESVLADE